MNLMTAALASILVLAPSIHAQQPPPNLYSESLLSTNLLGSHFGVPGIPATYDYVIVGGGTAGLTLARRLAANASVTVAVIEAGGLYETDNGNFSQIPAFATYWIPDGPPRNPLVDWYQQTEPQLQERPWEVGVRGIYYGISVWLKATASRECASPTDMLDFELSGSRGSYRRWADQVGDASYEFDNFLPYFQKSVKFTPPSPNRPANSTVKLDPASTRVEGGPLEIGFPAWVNGISSWIARSLDSLNVPELPGLLSGNILGWSYVTETIVTSTQTRSSSESSYLREALAQTTNLQIYKSTLATKVVFDASKRATGVAVDTGGYQYQINAGKEVILSAGAFRSPQLLLVSGVGPKETLAQQGITLLADRPGVGQNMMDHILFGTVYPVNLVTHSQLTTDPAFLARSIADYNQHRTGILTNCGGDLLGTTTHLVRNSFEKLNQNAISAQTRKDLDSTFGADWPDIELLFFDGNLVGAPTDTRNYVSSLAGIVAPFSRGNVTINSTDTARNPIINPNWLLDPRDQEIAVAGFKRARQIFQTESIRPILLGEEDFPGANVTSDEDILAVIRKTANSIDHAAGSCAMGKVGDRDAVVDSRARVIGVEGLRVVDASAFPLLPPGHPQATVYALAEKIADDILNGGSVTPSQQVTSSRS
ncbi:MAG: hypothetical protein Q9184_005170 [Pyrenodesmia sp. 2 TL-2023]